MGVDLKDVVKPRHLSLQQLAGEVLAIDAYNALYQFLAIIRGQSGEPLMDREGRITSHLSGLFYRNVNFLVLGIKPLYVLDGTPPSLKTIEIERRKSAKNEALIRYLEALRTGNVEQARKYAQGTSLIKDYMIEDTKRVLDLLGIPWILAPSEGEATAAYLSTVGVATATASQDFDSLLFGAKRLVRNLTISGRRKLPNRPVYVEVAPEEIVLKDLLDDLAMTREQLIDVGVLIGTDFNPDGFRGIGPAKAVKFVKTYGRLESIPDIQDKLAELDYKQIRNIFLYPRVARSVTPRWEAPEEGPLIDFLCKERDFSEKRVRNAFSRLKEIESNQSQGLEKWFS